MGHRLWALEEAALIYPERTLPQVEYRFRHDLIEAAVEHDEDLLHKYLDGEEPSVDDIKRAPIPAPRHRLILNFTGEAEQIKADTLIGQILETADTPAKGAA